MHRQDELTDELPTHVHSLLVAHIQEVSKGAVNSQLVLVHERTTGAERAPNFQSVSTETFLGSSSKTGSSLSYIE